jgi:chorismate synthase
VAKSLLKRQFGVEVLACVSQVKNVSTEINPDKFTLKQVESNIVRCPDKVTAEKMIRLIERVRKQGDSVGGVITGVARGVPAGWGAPVFDRLEADLAKAMLSLPASKGFDIGSGFEGIALQGSEHNDVFRMRGGRVRTVTNRSGGVQGGISNGETIYFQVAFKPTATVLQEQDTVSAKGKNVKLKARGRHDPCVLPRAVPVVEAMTALVLADHALRHRAQCGR